MESGLWLILSRLGEDFRFQDFEKELASLPGCYAPPAGDILIASVEEADGNRTDIGAVALRPVQVSSMPGQPSSRTMDATWTLSLSPPFLSLPLFPPCFFCACDL